MARIFSLGMQFRDIVGTRIITYARAKSLEAIRASAKGLCDEFIGVATRTGMKFITGNAYRSFTVGVYEYGELLEYYTTEGDEPTMRTLRKGQKYPLPRYYDGTPAIYTYVGQVGRGGQWGPTLGPYRIKKMRPSSRARWNMLVIMPVEYAHYDGLNHIFSTMTVLQDLLPGMFEGTIVKVKGEKQVKSISKFKKYT